MAPDVRLTSATGLGPTSWQDHKVRALETCAADLGVQITREHQAAVAAARSAIVHARQAGDLLLEAKRQLHHGEWLPWLSLHCPSITHRTAQNYMKVARHWIVLAAKNETVSDLPLRDALKLLADPRESHNTGDFEWYSPREYIEAARAVMGGIDLDPASCAAANQVVQATTFYDIQVDGLAQPWHGRVWLNPPYCTDLITAFSRKLLANHESGDVIEALVLCNNTTDTAVFHELASAAIGVCFPRGRVPFWRADGRETSSALQGQAVLYFGSHFDKFAVAFGEFGLIFRAFGSAHTWRLTRERLRAANGEDAA